MNTCIRMLDLISSYNAYSVFCHIFKVGATLVYLSTLREDHPEYCFIHPYFMDTLDRVNEAYGLALTYEDDSLKSSGIDLHVDFLIHTRSCSQQLRQIIWVILSKYTGQNDFLKDREYDQATPMGWLFKKYCDSIRHSDFVDESGSIRSFNGLEVLVPMLNMNIQRVYHEYLC